MKKLLALVLALVMTLSLCVTSNAAYSDAADVDYNEAVDVMSAVGVFQGADGKFSPKANLTREQAAKLIAYLDLGEKAAEALPAIKVFNDVEATRWSAKYVAYCADAGYINGVGNGNFDPAGKLTGYAFGKMLLCVLGYDAQIEGFTGSNWAINVATKLGSTDIGTGIDKAGSMTLTREEAAQYCLDTLQATMVQYGNKGVEITNSDGTKINVGADPATSVTLPVALQNVMGAGMPAGTLGTVELGEKLYKGDLKITANADAYGNIARQWTYKAVEVSNVADDATATFTKEVTYGDLYTAIGKTALRNLDDIAIYEDGLEIAASTNGGTTWAAVDGNGECGNAFNVSNITSGSKTKIGYDASVTTFAADDTYPTGNGVLTKVYVEWDGAAYDLTITFTNTYVVAATADYDTSKKELNITAGTIAANDYSTLPTGTGTTLKSDDFDNLTGIKKDDVLLVTVARSTSTAATVQTVTPAEKVSATATKYTTDKNVTAGGTTYSYSAQASGDVTGFNYVVNTATDYDLYLDAYGYVIWSEGTESTANYVFVTAAANEGNAVSGQYDIAKAVFTDGSTATIKVTHVGGTENSGVQLVTANRWYTYTKNSSDEYKLTIVPANTNTAAAANEQNAETSVTVTKGAASLPATADIGSSVTYVADSKTVFVVYNSTSKTYTAYTGVANVPTATGANIWVATGTGSAHAAYVYVTAAANNITSGADTTGVYVLGATASPFLTSADYAQSYDSTAKSNIYTYNVIMGGEKTEMAVKSANAPTYAGYYTYENTSDGYPTALVHKNTTGGKYEVQSVNAKAVSQSNGVMTVADVGSYVLADDVAVWSISATGSATSTSLSAFIADSSPFTGNLVMVYASTSDKTVKEIYFQKMAAAPVAVGISAVGGLSISSTTLTLAVNTGAGASNTVTYQLYDNGDTNSTTGGTLISTKSVTGTAGTTWTIASTGTGNDATLTTGNHYFYVVATETNSIGVTKTVTSASATQLSVT